MMLSCKEVARLLNSGELSRQGHWKRILVRFHLRMCEHCFRLERQLAQLRAAARAMTAPESPDIEARLLKKLSGNERNQP